MVKHRALIDLGSNSIKCLIYEPESRKVLLQYVKVGALAEGRAADLSLQPESINRNLDIIQEMIQKARKYGHERIDIYATAALRQAPNAELLRSSFLDRTGIEIQMLSPQEEAELSYFAAAEHLKGVKGAVFDIGGASLELSGGEGRHLKNSLCLDLGALVLSERFISSYPCPESDIQALQKYLETRITELYCLPEAEALVGVGGTVSTLAALVLGIYDAAGLEAFVMKKELLDTMVGKLKKLKLEEIAALPGMQEGREQSILAGALLCQSLLHYSGLSEYKVCTKGWRHALIYRLSET